MRIGIFPNLAKSESERQTQEIVNLCERYQVDYYVPMKFAIAVSRFFGYRKEAFYHTEIFNAIDVALVIGETELS